MTGRGEQVTGKDFIFCMYCASLTLCVCVCARVRMRERMSDLTTYIIDDFELERGCIKVKELT